MDTTERLHFHFSLSCIGEGNGNPLQCSRLENSGDGGAWWAAVYGVAQSRTLLKRLSSSQYSCLGNSMERGDWKATVHGVAKSQTGLSNEHCNYKNVHSYIQVCNPVLLTIVIMLYIRFPRTYSSYNWRFVSFTPSSTHFSWLCCCCCSVA